MQLLLIDKRECPTVAEQISAAFLGHGKRITNADIRELGGLDELRKFINQNEDLYAVFDVNKQKFYPETLSL